MATTSLHRRRPLLVFSLAVLLPGLAVAALGIGTLRQDRRLLDQQIRDRLDGAAGIAAAGLARELEEWDAAVAGLDASLDAGPPLDGARLPAIIRDALAGAGAAALIIHQPDAVRVLPAGALLYSVAGLEASSPREPDPPRALADAEALEFQRRDMPNAIRAYAAIAAAAEAARNPDLRARGLAGKARALRKAGRMAEARDAYATLGGMAGARVGALPAELLAIDARCEIDAFASQLRNLESCGLDLLRGLAEGRWPLEKARYVFYVDRARMWLASAGGAVPAGDAVVRLEAQKAAVTRAVEAAVSRQAGDGTAQQSGADVVPPPGVALRTGHLVVAMAEGVALAWRRPGPPSDGTITLVLAPAFVSGTVWPRALAESLNEQLRVSLVGPDGTTLFASDRDDRQAASGAVLSAAPGAASGAASTAASMAGPRATSAAAPVSTRDFQDGNFLWRVVVAPRDADALYAGLRVRQRLYAAMLALMVLSLVAGVVLTARTLRRELDVAERESQFVSAVSHEFRSPLAGIRQLSDMLVRQRVPDEARRQQYYLQIRRESDRLARMVEQVLDIARIKDGRAEYHLEPLDTAAWLRDVVADFAHMLDTTQREVIARIPDTLPPIRADRQALTTAVHNLLDNAVKYSPGTRTVWVEAEAAIESGGAARTGGASTGSVGSGGASGDAGGHAGGGEVIIRVRDEGVGIPLDEQPRVFDRFYRGRQLANEVGGTGLGLNLVSHIVAAHGGRVDVQSAPGRGSTFTIVVPIGGA